MSQLDFLLSVPTMGRIVDKFPSLTKPGPFTSLFQMGGIEKAPGGRYYYEKITNDRRLAAIRDYEAAGFVSPKPTRRFVDQGMIVVAEKEIITPKELFMIAAPGMPLVANAGEVIARAVLRGFARLHRTREYFCARLLQDASGVSISPSATAWLTGATQVTETVNIDGSLQTYAVAAGWDVETTRLISGDTQLADAQRTYEGNGFVAEHLIYSRDTAKAIVGNIEAQTWLSHNGLQSMEFYRANLAASARLQGEGADLLAANALSGIGDVPKHVTLEHHYTNGSGTVTRYMDDGKVIMLPGKDRLQEVLGFVEGPVFVPRNNNVIGAEAAAEFFDVKLGMQAYAMRSDDDVPTITICFRDAFVPVVRNENGVLCLTGVTS